MSALALLLVLAQAPDGLAAHLAELERAREPGWSAALAALGARGPAAARLALEDFAARDTLARRARAQLLTRLPAPELTQAVLALLADPDPEVRRWLVLLLGNPALAEVAGAERVQALERLARADPDRAVRARAREALVECALPGAVPALAALVLEAPPAEAGEAAAALARVPTGRERLIGLLTRPHALARAAHVELLAAYGRALAEVPGGGEARAERVPLLVARTHPALQVQAAARAALTTFVARAAELDEVTRAERVLAALGGEGWPPLECLRRRIDLAWLQRGDAAAALELARQLARATQALSVREAEAWEPRAALLEGAALAALGDAPGAARVLDELVVDLRAAGARRPDLFPEVYGIPVRRAEETRAAGPTAGGGAEAIDRLQLLGLAHLWRAYLVLPKDAERARAELRALHVAFLQARVIATRTRASDPAALDAWIEHELSPYARILFNERFAPEARGATLERALALSRALGDVAPLEMQGLAAEPDLERRRASLLRDPERLALLLALRAATSEELQRQIDELQEPLFARSDPERRELERRLWVQGAMIKQAEGEERRLLGLRPSPPPERVYLELLDYLAPSLHVHTLAGQLRGEDRPAEALELTARALETLRTAPLGSSPFWNELSSARLELLRGSVLMDESRPQEAEETYLAGEARLAALEAQVREWAQAAGDAEGLQAYLTQVRGQRGEALLALAVNANVRMGDPERALGYFERAYELNQSPFMRILRACYRARSGKHDEARTVLASVVPVPSLYYNIACTHALLGETEAALDYLELDV
ncbi:MAG TPA: HEAT repeat domain-containing protein, partial [Planctomycetota bacterium]